MARLQAGATPVNPNDAVRVQDLKAANVTGLGTLATQSGTFSGTSSGTNTGDQTLPVGANPSGSVALAAVNGSAMSFLRSDSAPPLSQAIAPIWTGLHTWTPGAGAGVPMTVNGDGVNSIANFVGTQGTTTLSASGAQIAFSRNSYNFITVTGAVASLQLQATGISGTVYIAARGATVLSCGLGVQIGAPTGGDKGAGTINIPGSYYVNGVAQPIFAAPTTGFGTPTGGSVIANFPGASATLAQATATIAQLLSILKAAGIIAT
jgi:hypothetical protein